MKEFPEKLCPANKEHFKDYQKTRDVCYLRRDIYEFLLHTDFDKDYFDSTIFFEKHKIDDPNMKKEILKKIVEELKQLSWNIGTVFDNTVLLIYPTKEELETCFWHTSIDFKCL